MKVLVAGLLATLLMTPWVGGCTLEPRYTRPSTPSATTWPTGEAYAVDSANGRAAADIGWREFFADARLQRLIEIALEHNPDARVATLNIAAARAQYRIQRASLFPSIDATGSETVEKYPATVAALETGGTGASDSGGSTFRFFNAGIGFTSYEVDVFGRIRSLNHERLQQYLGYVETRRSTQISLVAEVANAYLTVLADQELLTLTQKTLTSQNNSYALTKRSFEGGVSTELDLRQAQTTVQTAQVNMAIYTRQLAQDRNALVVLLGQPMPDQLPVANASDAQSSFLTSLPAGLPSDLIGRRPDILSAEHSLRASNADIGAARAAFFPSITLTGSYGTASTQLSGLFDHGSTAWTFSPQVSLPIFAAGANVAALDLSKVQRDVEIAQYEKAIETAFREVADALAGRGTLDRQMTAQQSLVEATSASHTLSEMRFRAGVDDYLSVLDSERAHYAAQQSLVLVKLSRIQNMVTLYKALGGGWKEDGQNPQTASSQSPDSSRSNN